MKILETQSAALSNYEVLVHLRAVQTRYATHPDYAARVEKNWKGDKIKVDGRLKNLRLVVTDLLRYLTAEESPLTSPNSKYDATVFRTLVQRLEKYNLTKTELIMIFNIRPKDLQALDVVVEEVDARLSNEEQEELLVAVGEVLGLEPVEEEEVEGGEEEGEGMDVDGA